jgi:hypothetical protein
MRVVLAATIIVGLAGSVGAQGFSEPPIQGPADASCRETARSEVFSAPNPNHLGLWDLGSQIYHSCMAAYHGRGPHPDRKESRF